MVMKKIVLFFMCLFCLCFSVDAKDLTGCAVSLKNTPQSQDDIQDDNNAGSEAEDVWEREYERALDEGYGSSQSPAFLNRENINPNEDEYDYSGQSAE